MQLMRRTVRSLPLHKYRCMKRLLTATFLFLQILAQGQLAGIAIIPRPVSLKATGGSFTLPQHVTIGTTAGPDIATAALGTRLTTSAGRKVTVQGNNGIITFQLNSRPDDRLGSEGYNLIVTQKNIIISANASAGLFYGAQTLLQLLPPAIEDSVAANRTDWKIPCVEITDYPRFAWRGLMFDVSRHFFTKAEVMRFIDNMVRYKYNLLHLHLADDEGWRMEIKGLPRLTDVGAWRPNKVGYFGTFTPPAPDEARDYGGFYTQDDIRDIVRYAGERHVNILPEIDVPGHSLAAIASYPELSCTPAASGYRVRSGEKIMDWSHGAPPIALVDNTLCPANERVYGFLDTVITQLAALFPFDYIHLGGDECPKNFWEKSDQIKALMQREKLKNMEEVQSYFEKRVEKIVSSKGKKFIGWDEILEGGLAPGAAVMSWRGLEGGIAAARMGHEVVMSPTTFAYLDYMQGDPAIESKVYASLSLAKTYQFDPMPPGVDPKYIKGGQANLWTEQVYNIRYAEYMIWPRAFAIAESLWSPKEGKSWNDFIGRVEKHFERFDSAGIRYAPSIFEPVIAAGRTADGQVRVELSTEAPDVAVYYSFDNSFPDRFYPKYSGALTVPRDAVQLKTVSYRGTQPVGRPVVISVDELKSRADKKK